LFQITADTKVAAGAENASQKFAQTAFIKVKLYDTDAGEGLSNETGLRGGRQAGAEAELGSFRFVWKATSDLVPSGWSAELGSFGISCSSGKGRLKSGVAMASFASFPLQLKRELQEIY
jgi:hypothetical protein